jgi:hypothetical protein
LDVPETVDTPFVKVRFSAVPKFVAVPVVLVTVGLLEPIEAAPLKVRLCAPV